MVLTFLLSQAAGFVRLLERFLSRKEKAIEYDYCLVMQNLLSKAVSTLTVM